MDDSVPRLRSESPLSGLERRKLRPVQVFAQSVSATAPAAAMAVAPVVVAVTAGPAVIWSFVLAMVLALLIGVCIAQFTRRMAAAGSLYSLTAKGLGPAVAFACGCALLIGYGLLSMAMLTGSGIYLRSLASRLGWGLDGVPAAAAVVLVLGLVAALCAVRGVRLSAQVVLVTEAMSIALILVVLTVRFARLGPPDLRPLLLPENGIGGVAAGVLPALGAFVGFEAAASLSVEARRPFRTIPRAVQWTAGLAGVLYLVAAYAQGVGLKPVPAELIGSPESGGAMAELHHPPWLPILLDTGIAASFFACALATGNAVARVLFSMGREGVAPRRFGAAHPKYRTPHIAVAVLMPVVVAVPILLLVAGMPAGRLFITLINIAVFGYLLGYLLVCLAAPVFLRRIGELTGTAVASAAVAVPVLLVVLVAFVVKDFDEPYPLVLALLMAMGFGWYAWLRVHRPQRIPGIGIYDETSTADVLAPDVLGGVP